MERMRFEVRLLNDKGEGLAQAVTLHADDTRTMMVRECLASFLATAQANGWLPRDERLIMHIERMRDTAPR